ncbi:orotidine-5'-phosphate decarboxylase [soil metagenome]
MNSACICVAIDTPDSAQARHLVREVADLVGTVKLGMEFFYANGPAGYEAVAAAGPPVFLDLKLHDIPNTVAAGLRSLMRLSPAPAIINIHAAGGSDMMKAAADAIEGRAKLIAVTILTSLSDADLGDIGYDGGSAGRLALLAQKAGLDGVVCSPADVAEIRRVTGAKFLTVVPGIRPADSDTQDQKRIATPEAARRAGADILVIGRPITGASDPRAATRAIAESLEAAHAG